MMNKKFYGIALCGLLSLAACPSMASNTLEFEVENQFPNTQGVRFTIDAFQKMTPDLSFNIAFATVGCFTGNNCTFHVSPNVDILEKMGSGRPTTSDDWRFTVKLEAMPDDVMNNIHDYSLCFLPAVGQLRKHQGWRRNPLNGAEMLKYDEVVDLLKNKRFKIGPERNKCTEIKGG